MNKNEHKLCFIDTETTGLCAHKNNIFQLSAKILTPDAGEILDEINLKFRPHSLEHYSVGAMETTGVTLDDWKSYPLSSEDAFKQFSEWVAKHVNRYEKKDKLQFVAYNALFDSDFVRQWYEKNGDNYYGAFFFHPPICVMQAAAWFTQRVRGVFPNFTLGTICKCAELGWDDEQAHDADYDVVKTIELFRYLQSHVTQL
mgnify:CR=1 FL=1